MPNMAACQQATPAADIRPSGHTYTLGQEEKAIRIMVPHYGIDWANNAFTKYCEERINVRIELLEPVMHLPRSRCWREGQRGVQSLNPAAVRP